MVERVAKRRVSDSKDGYRIVKSRIRVRLGGNSKKLDSGTQKVGYFVGYHALFTPNFMFCFIRSGAGSVGYIPDLEKSGSGSPKKVWVGSGIRKIWVSARPLLDTHASEIRGFC